MRFGDGCGDSCSESPLSLLGIKGCRLHLCLGLCYLLHQCGHSVILARTAAIIATQTGEQLTRFLQLRCLKFRCRPKLDSFLQYLHCLSDPFGRLRLLECLGQAFGRSFLLCGELDCCLSAFGTSEPFFIASFVTIDL